MTFDDDFIQLRLATGPLRVTCKELGIDWPPPERIAITGGPLSVPIFRRVRFSHITDEQRLTANVIRGAEYVHDSGVDDRLRDQFRQLQMTGAAITLPGRRKPRRI